MVGKSLPGGRIVRGLGFPHQDSILYIDIPGAGTCAVDPVGGSHLFVILGAATIKILPAALAATGRGPTIFCFVCLADPGDIFWSKETKGRQKRTFGHMHLHKIFLTRLLGGY
jgi:hypothetical protein